MAGLIKISSPGNYMSSADDWGKITALFNALGMTLLNGTIFSLQNYTIYRGSIVFYAGSFYVAQTDITPTGAGTRIYFVPEGEIIVPYLVTSLSGVIWNKTWQGWYDANGCLYFFDEIQAFANSEISYPEAIYSWRPNRTVAKLLAGSLDATWLPFLAQGTSGVYITGALKLMAYNAALPYLSRSGSGNMNAAIYSNAGWAHVGYITFNGLVQSPIKISAFTLNYKNAASYEQSQFRVIDVLTGEVVLVSADASDITVVATCNDHELGASRVYDVQYLEWGSSDWRGPFTLTTYATIGDGTTFSGIIFNMASNGNGFVSIQ